MLKESAQPQDSDQPIDEAASHEEQDSALRRALNKQFGPAYGDTYPGGEYWVGVIATYDDHVIICGQDGKNYRVSYMSDGADGFTFGDPAEVRVTYEPVRESVQAHIVEVAGSEGREWDVILIEAGMSLNNRYYPADVLQAAVPLFEGVTSFADHATDAERLARPERSVKDKVGKFSNPEFGSFEVRGQMVEGVKARFKIIAPWLRETLVEAVKADEPDFLGFSIDGEGRVERRVMGGRMVDYVESISRISSVDVVTDPAAGGRVMRLVASNAPTQDGDHLNMNPEELKALIEAQIKEAVESATSSITETVKETATNAVAEALKEAAPPPPPVVEDTPPPAVDPVAAKVAEMEQALVSVRESQRKADATRKVETALEATRLSEASKGSLRSRFAELIERRDPSDEELKAAVDEQVALEAALLGEATRPMGVGGRSVHVGDGMHEKLDKGIQGMFTGQDVDGIPAFRSIKEAYCRWTGQDGFEVSAFDIHRAFSARYDSAVDHSRIRESLATSSWGEIYADNLYIRLIAEYRASEDYDKWRMVASDIENVPDFQTRHWPRIGGYGDLDTVAEQATYPTLTSPTDEEVTYSISKKGGIDDVTFESIVNDRFGAIRRIPTGMARAASRTLYKDVFDMITTDNPTMGYDSTQLYASGHGNTGTTALTLAGFAAVVAAMRDQTAYNESSEILGARNKPKIIIVPNELEFLAQRMFNPSMNYVLSPTADTDGSIDPNAFRGMGMMVHVYDQLTDANNWYVVANPAQVPTLVVGFLNGRQEPELFVQDQPNVGSAFTADKVSYKCRFIWGLSVLDHRSYYRQVVT